MQAPALLHTVSNIYGASLVEGTESREVIVPCPGLSLLNASLFVTDPSPLQSQYHSSGQALAIH